MSRREERRAAAFLLYQRDLLDSPFPELYAAYERDNGSPVSPFSREQAEGAWDERGDLDRLIDSAAAGWSADRMAVLERNVLRLAVHELRTGEVPPAVAIDEAVSLAKRYASPEAGIAREWDTGEHRPNRGGGDMTEQIEGLTAEIADLRARLERENLDADAATEVLERITALAQRALDEVERQAGELEQRQPST